MENEKIIDGKKLASEIRGKVKILSDEFKAKTNLTPGLAVVLVGENPASMVYVKNKIKQTEEVGFKSFEYKLPIDTSEEELLNIVDSLNKNQDVNGILRTASTT